MSEETSGIQIGELSGIVLIRIEGKGTHLNSHLLKKYLLNCLEENRCHFQIDLSCCNYMDSTFLGMLTGLGSKIKERSLPTIKLINASERIIEMLENLGVYPFFEIVKSESVIGSFKKLQGSSLGKDDKSREMLEAHENLVSISQANEAKFRDVVALLREKASQ